MPRPRPPTVGRRRPAATAAPLAALLLAALLLAARPATAAEPAQAPLAINGFGTAGLVHSSQSGGDFVFDNLQPWGAGRSHRWSSDVDSRLGVQLTANLTPQLSAVLQMVTEYRWDNSYHPFVNWANVKYAFTPDFSVRVGRIALASFLASDSRKVGYSNLTARPPSEVYRLLALRDSDGVDAVYRSHHGTVSNSVTLLYGKRTVTNTRGIEVHSTGVKGIFDTLESGPLTLHAAYQQRDVDNQNPPRGRFMSLGASYDPGPWFASAEWVKAINYDGKGLKVLRAAGYLNAGVRLGDFAPYATVAELRPLSDTGAAPVAQRSYAVGVRWDVARNLDLKLQWDRLKLGDNSYGTLQNVVPGTPRGGHVNLISVVTDFIF
ncbi:porin [Rugamonas sp. CCM 8940]|uniref:porin n=1 Tax=Rugamonas sp. CCM 8940 TaxID=2765359 RepID=UPI0018F4179F|nr:porin [Rugamonas sp. CCM 8940]MBJ7312732.1 porin [Rugamonas sp. CCM 8940]